MNWGKFIAVRYIISGSVKLGENFQGTKLTNKFGNVSEEKSFGASWGNNWGVSFWGNSKKSEWKGTNWGNNENKNNGWGGTSWGKAW